MNARLSSRIRVSLLVGGLLLCCGAHAHAFDLLLRIEGINGESQNLSYVNWIDVSSYAHGITRAAANGTPGTARSVHQELSIMKNVDKASPKIYEAVSKGNQISTVTLIAISYTNETPAKILEIKLSNVVITSVQPAGATTDTAIRESVSFSYAKIRWIYYYQDPLGFSTPYPGGWDAANNQSMGTSAAKPILLKME